MHNVCRRCPQGRDDHVWSSSLLATHRQMPHARPSIAGGARAYRGTPSEQGMRSKRQALVIWLATSSCAWHWLIAKLRSGLPPEWTKVSNMLLKLSHAQREGALSSQHEVARAPHPRSRNRPVRTGLVSHLSLPYSTCRP